MVRLVLLFSVLLASLGFAGAEPARASPASAYPTCHHASDSEMSLTEARALPETAWDCTLSLAEADVGHIWLRFDMAHSAPSADSLSGTAMPFERMVLAMVHRDGTVDERTLGPDTVAANWRVGTRFSVPLGTTTGDLSAVYLRVDNAMSPQFARLLTLENASYADAGDAGMLTLVGIFIGMLIVTAIASGMIAAAIRRNFGHYHLAFTLFLLLYTVSSSSVIYLLVPDLDLWARTILSYSSLALAVAMIGPLILDFFEEDSLPGWAKGMIRFSMGMILMAAIMMPLNWATGVPLRHHYNLSFMPGAIAIVVAVAVAMRRGSRSARIFAAAWAIPLVFSLERIARGMDLYALPPVADFMFYGAMALEAMAMTAGIIWRFNELRLERDQALARSEAMAAAALTDSLTGLPNRRDFDGRRPERGSYLVLLDLDRFKALNDGYGHATGDAALAAVGKLLAEAVESGDARGAWRLGGEEFALSLAPECAAAAALRADAIRARIPLAIDSELPGLDAPITASAGLAPLGSDGLTAAYEAADRRLYAAKRAGRDRLCAADPSQTEQLRLSA